MSWLMSWFLAPFGGNFAFKSKDKELRQTLLVVNGPLRAKHNPKICKQTKFKLYGRFMASPMTILASWLLSKQPLQMVLVAHGLRRTKHNPEICKQTKFELSGRFLSSPRPIFAFLFLNNQPLQMVFVINGPHHSIL